MPNFCAVVGCGSRGDRDRNSFFRIPCLPCRGQPETIALKTERRMKWILALRRKDLTDTKLKYALICDRHFISGRPAATRDIYNPDWVPNQNMGYDTKPAFPKRRNQKENKEAIICYLTPSAPEQVPEENIECEVISLDKDSLSTINFTCSSEERHIDCHRKQDENKDAIICYIKPSNPEQSQLERTEHKTMEQNEGSQSGMSVSDSQDRQADPLKKQDLNKGVIIRYITPNNSQPVQVKRTSSEIIDQNEDS